MKAYVFLLSFWLIFISTTSILMARGGYSASLRAEDYM